MSWATSGWVDLSTPPPIRPAFIALETTQKEMFDNHSRISRADQDPYASRVYLRIWLNEKEKKVGGAESCVQEGFRSQCSHNGRFVQDGISLVHREGQDCSFPSQAESFLNS